MSTLLSVPEPLDDWLPDVGPLEELEPPWDLDWACDGDRVDWACEGDWGRSPSFGISWDIGAYKLQKHNLPLSKSYWGKVDC